MDLKKFYESFDKNDIDAVGVNAVIFGREIGEYSVCDHGVGFITGDEYLNGNFEHDVLEELTDGSALFQGDIEKLTITELIIELKDGSIIRVSTNEHPTRHHVSMLEVCDHLEK